MHLPAQGDLERWISRLLLVGTYASVALLATGVVVLLTAGRSPLDDGPVLDPGRIPADVAALRPEGFLWLGLASAVATPAARVVVALVGFARANERGMALVAAAILGIMILTLVVAANMEV